jgi:hypothetical protein
MLMAAAEEHLGDLDHKDLQGGSLFHQQSNWRVVINTRTFPMMLQPLPRPGPGMP